MLKMTFHFIMGLRLGLRSHTLTLSGLSVRFEEWEKTKGPRGMASFLYGLKDPKTKTKSPNINLMRT